MQSNAVNSQKPSVIFWYCVFRKRINIKCCAKIAQQSIPMGHTIMIGDE